MVALLPRNRFDCCWPTRLKYICLLQGDFVPRSICRSGVGARGGDVECRSDGVPGGSGDSDGVVDEDDSLGVLLFFSSFFNRFFRTSISLLLRFPIFAHAINGPVTKIKQIWLPEPEDS